MRESKYSLLTDSATFKKVYKRKLCLPCNICAPHSGDNKYSSGHKGKRGVKKPKYKNRRVK